MAWFSATVLVGGEVDWIWAHSPGKALLIPNYHVWYSQCFGIQRACTPPAKTELKRFYFLLEIFGYPGVTIGWFERRWATSQEVESRILALNMGDIVQPARKTMATEIPDLSDLKWLFPVCGNQSSGVSIFWTQRFPLKAWSIFDIHHQWWLLTDFFDSKVFGFRLGHAENLKWDLLLYLNNYITKYLLKSISIS